MEGLVCLRPIRTSPPACNPLRPRQGWDVSCYAEPGLIKAGPVITKRKAEMASPQNTKMHRRSTPPARNLSMAKFFQLVQTLEALGKGSCTD